MKFAVTVDLPSLYGFPLMKRMAVPMYRTSISICIYVISEGLDTMDMYFLVTTHALASRKEKLRNDFLI
ncbi:hypothetical protein ACFLV5_06270 [Chloroflexota bacterium]